MIRSRKPTSARLTDLPVYSAAYFGFNGNGVVDNVNCWTDVGTEATAVGGMHLMFGEGVFVTSASINSPSNIKITGIGPGVTEIGALPAITGANLFSISADSNICLEDLSFRHNRADQVSGHTIRMADATNVILRHVTVEDAYNYAIGMQTGVMTRIILDGVKVQDTGIDAIDIKDRDGGNSDIIIRDLTVGQDNLRAVNPGTAGVDIRCRRLRASGVLIEKDFPFVIDVGFRFRQGEPDWADATDYLEGDVVLSGGTAYICIAAHTSSGTIDLAKFVAYDIDTALIGDGTGYGSSHSYITGLQVKHTGGTTGYGYGATLVGRKIIATSITGERLASAIVLPDSSADCVVSGLQATACTVGVADSGRRNRVSDVNAIICGTSYEYDGQDGEVSNFTSYLARTVGFSVISTSTNLGINNCRSIDDATTLSVSSTDTGMIISNSPSLTGDDAQATSGYYGPMASVGVSALTLVEDRLYLVPIWLPNSLVVDHIGFGVSTGAGDASCQVRVGLYGLSAGVYTLLKDAGTIAIGTSTGSQTKSLSGKIAVQGRIFVGLICNRNGGAGAMPIVNAYPSTSGARVLVGSTTASFADSVYTATIYNDQVVASWAAYTLPATVSVTRATTDFPAAGVSAV
jgi:hypothetical protein